MKLAWNWFGYSPILSPLRSPVWRYTVYIRILDHTHTAHTAHTVYLAVGSDRGWLGGLKSASPAIGLSWRRRCQQMTCRTSSPTRVGECSGHLGSLYDLFLYERWVDDGKDLFRLDSTWLNGLTILRIVFWSMFSVSLIVNPMIHFKVKQQGKPFILQPLAEWLVLGGWERLRTTWSQGGRWFSSNRNPPFDSHPGC